MYAVARPSPIATGAGRLVSMGPNSLELAIAHPGSVHVRVRWSPYWQLSGVRGCVAPSGQFTLIEARGSGRARLGMAFSLARIGLQRSRAAISLARCDGVLREPATSTCRTAGSTLLRQLLMFVVAYAGYEIVRGLVGVTGNKPFGDATRIIDFERTLHVFAEPSIQSWVMSHAHWLLDVCDWTYLNAHFALTVGALAFIYLRRNDSFYFVRNMFMIAMLIALVGYSVFPTAPPRLMPQWGFTDSIQQFTGVTVEHGVERCAAQCVRRGAVDARVLRADDRTADVTPGAPPRSRACSGACTRCSSPSS